MRNFVVSASKWLPVLAAVVWLAACHYRDPFGGEWNVDPRPRTPNQTPGCTPTILGQVTVGGVTYNVWDFDCDGDGDFISDPEGNYRPIAPIRPSTPPSVSNRARLDPDITVDIDEEQSYAEYLLQHTSTFDDPGTGSTASGFKNPLSFDFGASTAAEWRAQYGLIGFNQANRSRSISLDIEFDQALQAVDMEVVLPWSTEYRFVAAHPNLRFEADVLCDQSGPGFMVLRVGGTPADVLRYLMHTAGSFSMSSFDVSTGTEFGVAVDESQGTALITANGKPLQLLQL